MLLEIPALRAAQMWSSLNSAALEWFEREGGFVLRVEDLRGKNAAPRTAVFLSDLLGNCQAQNGSDIGFTPVRRSPVKLSSWSADSRAHVTLLTQLRDVAGTDIVERLGYTKKNKR